MKYKNLNYLVFFIYLISSSGSYSIERPDVKNLIIHKEKKKIEKVEFFNSKNKKISLNDYKSNVVIINFWATWCAPCKKEMPSLDKLYQNSNFKNVIHKIYFCLALNFGLVLLITYTRPRLLTNLEFKSLFLIDFNELFIFIIIIFSRRRPTLPCLKTKYHRR